MKKILPGFFIFVLLLTACAPAVPDVSRNGIEIYDARVFLPGGEAMKGMQTSLAGFMMLKNISAAGDRLIGVSADFADASLHETIIKADVVKMDEISGVDVPAGQMVELRSGSYHIMLVNSARELKPGEHVNLTLEFEKAGQITVSALVTDK